MDSAHHTVTNHINTILPLDHWKSVVGYESLYEVSVTGRVRRKKSGRLLKPTLNSTRYAVVRLHRACKGKTTKIHRIVMGAFAGAPPLEKPQVNHRNGIKTENRFSNLEYVSARGNFTHAIETGLFKHPAGDVLSDGDVVEIRRLQGLVSPKELSRRFGVARNTISNIHRRVTHKHL